MQVLGHGVSGLQKNIPVPVRTSWQWIIAIRSSSRLLLWESRLARALGPPSCVKTMLFSGFVGPSWCFSGSKGCHWELFFEPRGSLGRYVEGLGVPLGGFGAQSLLKNASLFHARYLSSDVGAKMGTGNVSKRGQKVNKKTIQNSINKSMRFGIAFLLDFCRSVVSKVLEFS